MSTRTIAAMTLTPPAPVSATGGPLTDLDVPALGELIRRAASALAQRTDPAATSELACCLAAIGGFMGGVGLMGASWSDCGWTRWRWPHDEPAPQLPAATEPSVLELTFRAVAEATPGPAWKALFEEMWPAYRSWYLSEGETTRPDVATCREMMRTYMPELVPTWERLVALAGDDELAARMLSMWEPPRFLPGCTQAVLTQPAVALVRNYDYDPELFEAVIASTRWSDRRVIGTSDCLWGLLDGMNEQGLAVSLAFGGWPGSGRGFAIPLVVRYLLEVADTVEAACAILRDLPVAMAYNLTMVDRDGQAVTAFVSPGRAPEFSALRVATNHRGTAPDYPEHAAGLHSVERQEFVLRSLSSRSDPLQVAGEFLLPPLRRQAYAQAFGTLYTALYQPATGRVSYSWPGDSWDLGFDTPSAARTVRLATS